MRSADLSAFQRTVQSAAALKRCAPARHLIPHQTLRGDAYGDALLPLLAEALRQSEVIVQQRAHARRQQQQREQRFRQTKAALLTDRVSPSPADSSQSSRVATA